MLKILAALWAATTGGWLGWLSAGLKLLTAPLVGPLATAGAVALGFALMLTNGHLASTGRQMAAARADAATYQALYQGWRTYGQAEQAAFARSEQIRTAENDVATAAVTDLQKVCQAREAEARRSASEITALLNKDSAHETSPLPDGTCPVRELVDPDGLRHALQPATGANTGR